MYDNSETDGGADTCTAEGSTPGFRADRLFYRVADSRSLVLASLLSVLGICAFYYFYRYPFRINSASTSPTYHNTPRWLQEGKYVLLAVVEAPLALVLLRARAWRRQWAFPEAVLAGLGLFAFARAAAAVSSGGGISGFDIVGPVLVAIPIGLAVGLPGLGARDEIARIARVTAVGILAVNAIADVVELVLWRATGRLPALAYAASLKRFGGLWDDPNSCALYAACFGTYLLARWRTFGRMARALLACGVLLELAAAFSYSGWLAFVVGLVALGVQRVRRRGLALALVAAAVAILVAAPFTLGALHGVPVVGHAIRDKQASLRQRLDPGTYFVRPRDLLGWVVGSSRPVQVEDAYGAWFSGGGAVGLALLLGFAGSSLASSRSGRGFDWLVSVTAAFLVSSLFVPHLIVFPVATMFVLLLAGVAAAGRDEPAYS